MRAKIDWARVTAEGAAIIVSILLAFAIQAWWEGVGERAEERVALAGLTADFASYLEALAKIRQSNELRIDAARRLTEASGLGPPSLSDAEVLADLATVVMYRGIHLQPRTLGSLLETNRLVLVGDAALRSKLIDWDQNQRIAEEQNTYMLDTSRALDAFLKSRFPMEATLRLTQDPTADVSEAEARFQKGAASLLQDFEFTNHLVYTSDASAIIIRRVGVLEVLANEILELLHANEVDE